jgi:hypothetical protein
MQKFTESVSAGWITGGGRMKRRACEWRFARQHLHKLAGVFQTSLNRGNFQFDQS